MTAVPNIFCIECSYLGTTSNFQLPDIGFGLPAYFPDRAAASSILNADLQEMKLSLK